MPTRRFAIEPGGEKRLEISWRPIWREIQVRLDGALIGVIPDRNSLRAGQQFSLPDGSILHIQLVRNVAGPELQITRNGQPLPGSASDPAQRVKAAAGVAYFIGGANLIVGLAAALGVEFLAELGYGWSGVLTGLIFLILAFFIQRRSIIALGLAVALFALDTVFSVVYIAQHGASPPITGFIVRFFLFVPLIMGFGAMRALKR